MFKFGEYLTERVSKRPGISASGKEMQRHHDKYIRDYLPDADPSISKHGPGTHEFNSDHVDPETGFKFPVGSRVHLVHNEIKNGKNHVTVSDEAGNKTTVLASKLARFPHSRDPERVENDQIAQIQNAIELHRKNTGKNDPNSPVRIRFGDGNHIGASGIKKVTRDQWKELGYNGTGAPKADAYFHGPDGKPTHFISLKGTSHQQWGGVAQLVNHPSVQRGVSSIKSKLEQERTDNPKFNSAIRHYLDPENEHDKDLIHKSMYGIGHGREYGLSNVHRIIGGDISLVPGENGELNLNSTKSYVNRNDKTSDVHPDNSMIWRTSSGKNSHGTGGRMGIGPTEWKPSGRPTAETAQREARIKQAAAPVEATPANGNRAPSAEQRQHTPAWR
jgi:hypothetical protein